MSQLLAQGIPELSFLFISEIKDKSHSQFGYTLDFVCEILILILVYLLCEDDLRINKNKQDRKEGTLSKIIGKWMGWLTRILSFAIIILAVLSLKYDNEWRHVIINLVKALLLFGLLRQYSRLMTFCEAVLLSKICGEFFCLIFGFIGHFYSPGNASNLDIAQVADLFLISSVLIPALSFVLLRWTRSIYVPMTLIFSQILLLLFMVNGDVILLFKLTMGEEHSWTVFLFMLCVTVLGLVLSHQMKARAVDKTIIRKVFHIQVVMILTCGIYGAPSMSLMACSGLIWIFLIAEYMREQYSTSIVAFNKFEQFVFQFIDERDCKRLVITHIYLLLGVAYPLIHEYSLATTEHKGLFYDKSFSGIIVLGIGDTFAAIIGKTFGRIRFISTNKTLEGLAAFVGSVILFIKFFNYILVRNSEDMISMDDWFYIKLLFIALIECFTKQIDNLLLPILYLEF